MLRRGSIPAGTMLGWYSRRMRGAEMTRKLARPSTGDEAGFVLIELLVVIAIIGVLIGLSSLPFRR